MRLYHGSSCVVERPDVTYSRGNLDFGRGFYATSYAHQAESWALRKAAVQHAGAFVSEYDMAEAFDEYHVLRFDQPDEKWVRFVCDCRKGADVYKGYDLIVGGVADDKVYFAVDMYYRGLWDMETTLKALRFYKVNDQWCFVSQRAADGLLRFSGSWEVTR